MADKRFEDFSLIFVSQAAESNKNELYLNLSSAVSEGKGLFFRFLKFRNKTESPLTNINVEKPNL